MLATEPGTHVAPCWHSQLASVRDRLDAQVCAPQHDVPSVQAAGSSGQRAQHIRVACRFGQLQVPHDDAIDAGPGAQAALALQHKWSSRRRASGLKTCVDLD